VSAERARWAPRSGARRNRGLRLRLSDAELAEIARRAARAGVSQTRYVVDAALTSEATVSERRLWAAEVLRAERVMRSAVAGLEELVAATRAGTPEALGGAEAITAVRDAAETVRRMGQASSEP